MTTQNTYHKQPNLIFKHQRKLTKNILQDDNVDAHNDPET